MIHVINRVKARFHYDMAAHPESHGWVLNLYRGGERYPQRVCDYFQSDHAPSPQLAAAITDHAEDEDQHVERFAHALRLRGQEVVEIEIGDVFNEVIRSFTPDTFHIVDDDTPDAKRRKLANFLAHAHHLEKRVETSFAYHLDACGSLGLDPIATIVASVQRDEHRHVRYTREAVSDLLTRREAEAVMDTHRRAEAKANLIFSQRQVRTFVRRFRDTCPRRRRMFYRFCAGLMEGAGCLV
ncbi:MAG: hypothetical protein GC159_24005 [Phycisphaera sp.]|nr:hypothetical protein [Phycisphaera sp.]